MTDINYVWRPIPGSSQAIALDSRAHQTLYCGTRGPGKTDTQLMRFRRNVGRGYGSFWRGVIFDKQYKNLDDLVLKSKRWFPKFNDGAKWLSSGKDYKWVWPTGEELLFRQFAKPDDYWNYHGHEFPFIGWNELTKYATSECYESMLSCNRSSFTLEKNGPRNKDGNLIRIPPIPLEVFSTTNPFGIGHYWVKSAFIDPAPYGTLIKEKVKVFDPKTKREVEVVTTKVAIFGSYKENIYLDPLYVANLNKVSDENKRKAWLHGSWDIVAGGAISDVWNRAVHVIPRFKRIPATWYVDRAMDWGSSKPFSIGWFAEANGEEAILADGTTFCPPPGTIIQFWEWYGSNAIGSNIGIKLGSTKVAKGIREVELSLIESGLIPKAPYPGPADNSISDVDDDDAETIEDKFLSYGIAWEKSNKSPGSRINGLELIRDRLEAALDKEDKPRLYFTNNCTASIATIPILPRDEKRIDDVDSEAEDHAYDMVRYRVLKSGNRYVKRIEGNFYGTRLQQR